MTVHAQIEEAFKQLDPEAREQVFDRLRYLKDEGGFGRPSKYNPEMAQKAAVLAKLGVTDEEMADYLCIDVRTLYRWKAKYPDFSHATKLHKDCADDRVEESLFKQATTGNVTAAIFWLKNRRAADWRDKREIAVSDHRTEEDIERALEQALERKFLSAKAVDVTEDQENQGKTA